MSNMNFMENAIYSEDDIMTLHALQGHKGVYLNHGLFVKIEFIVYTG